MPSRSPASEFVAELYLPSNDPEQHRAAIKRARQTAAEQSRRGTQIRYRRAVFLPGDETCFPFFQADSAQAVGQLGTQAELLFDRIVEATTI